MLTALAVVLTSPVACRPAAEPQMQTVTAPFSSLSGATGWINSGPLTQADLKGKVVLVDFWTYSCINCLRSLPYMRAWADKYKDAGLVVIGVHSPEFGFEAELPKVERAVRRFGVTYPVALDGNHAIWNAFHNEYWPAHYFIDAQGRIRHTHFGEGNYDRSEQWIRELLAERNSGSMPRTATSVHAEGIEQAADFSQARSPETYLGYSRAERFGSPEGLKPDAARVYPAPALNALNLWALSGKWNDHAQFAELQTAGGRILYRFHARDLHLVLGPGKSGKTVRFRITIDGHPPGESHGVDTDAEGNGTVVDYRLYQLVRQKGTVTDRLFTIEFLDPGVQAFAFTFG